MTLEAIDLARLATDVLADQKAEDILLMDISQLTVIADYFVIGTGTSDRHIRALYRSIDERCKQQLGADPLHVEGDPESGWVLMDYGGVVVHIFEAEMRAFYDLEHLWRDARVVLHMQ